MHVNPRFIEYFRETFFKDNPAECTLFLESLEKPIPRTLRIKPQESEGVRKRLEEYGFILGKTSIENVFTLDRADSFDPLERRIGYTVDHLVGNFYIQELAAATSVHILSSGKISQDEFLILDMAASPGGKTTQLAEQYPNSFIVANEPTRERIPQLLQNLDRMGSYNIGVTLYPGQYFRTTPEVFDRILLDAPCSGEGTLFKGTEATKHWHIKNIRTISRLQEKLIEAALIALKVGGEMVYSTCSMNLLENEGVLESIKTKYPDAFTITYEKRFWPHKDNTGGFFVSKIQKIASIKNVETTMKRGENSNEELRTYKSHISKYKLKKGRKLYEHTAKILSVIDHKELENIRKKYYFMRWGERVGYLDRGEFIPDFRIQREIEIKGLRTYNIQDEATLDNYLRGGHITINLKEGEVFLSYQDVILGREHVDEHGVVTNSFPSDWRRK